MSGPAEVLGAAMQPASGRMDMQPAIHAHRDITIRHAAVPSQPYRYMRRVRLTCPRGI